MVPSRPFSAQHNSSRKRVMSRRRRPRSPQRVVSRRIVNAAAASVLLCAGSGSRVDAFCSTSPSSAAARRYPVTTSSSTATTQQQPHRLRFGGASASASPLLWSSRLESNARISSSSSLHLSATAAAGIGASAFVPRSQGRTATAMAGRRGRQSAVRALGMAADVLTSLGRDALMFLAATVAVVPACKKLNIR